MNDLCHVMFKVLVGMVILGLFVYLWVVPTVTGLMKVLG